ncbi:MAG: HD domain-containing protein, partial [Lachnospiraceae bacterium]|nr:HD domain-containing protein [Lachnospiraceae bacterium]
MGENKKKILISTGSFKLMADISRMLNAEYDMVKAIDGAQTIRALSDKNNRIDCLIIDLALPNTNIFQIMNLMHKNTSMKYIPIIVLADSLESEDIENCFDSMAADILMTPVNPNKLLFSIRRCLKEKQESKILEAKVNIIKSQANEEDTPKPSEENVRDSKSQESSDEHKEIKYDDLSETDKRRLHEEDISDLQHAYIYMIGTVAEFRGLSKNHIKRVREITAIMCDSLISYFPEAHLTKAIAVNIADASCLHDIGKILIPDEIMMKPTKLTDEEFDMVKSHTTKGCEILEALREFQTDDMYHYSYEICRYHHERYDGKGYPEKLKGESIPLSAQIVSIVDAFDA